MTTSRPRTPASERVWKHIDKQDGGCWLWTASTSPWGYGQIIDWSPEGKKTQRVAHRLVYELVVGPIPEGLDLDHLCRVRRCVNPSHLEPVTRWENLRRGDTSTSRRYSSLTCRNGHLWADGNEYINEKTNVRSCRTCSREFERDKKGLKK